MVEKLALSGKNLDIDYIWTWYEISKKSIMEFKESMINCALNNRDVPDYFAGMTLNEIDEFFDNHLNELDYLVSFNLLSAAEASIKIDFLRRVWNRDKDAVSKKFRVLHKSLHKSKGIRAKLDEHILKIWDSQSYRIGGLKKIIGEFRGALNFRNWLAHGRFWFPKLGRKYDAETVFSIIQAVLSGLELKYK